jgi:hypothetical protein
MKKIKFWLHHEVDAELFACVYAACLVWLTAFFRFLAHADGLGFWTITQILILGWAIAWGQKLIYWQEGTSRRGEVLRGIVWWGAPAAAVWAAQAAFGWFEGCPAWMGSAFSAAMAATLLAWWLCMRLICRDESREWNTLLAQFRAREQAAQTLPAQHTGPYGQEEHPDDLA